MTESRVPCPTDTYVSDWPGKLKKCQASKFHDACLEYLDYEIHRSLNHGAVARLAEIHPFFFYRLHAVVERAVARVCEGSLIKLFVFHPYTSIPSAITFLK